MHTESPFGRWQAPAHWLSIDTLDCHTGGEPLRIITRGFPVLPQASILEQRRACQQQDHLRKLLMFEPRGHADMYGCLIVPPERSDSAFGAVFLHNEGYSTMCGHAVIALAKVAAECGMVAVENGRAHLNIDVPCGQVRALAELENGQVVRSGFENVASYVASDLQQIQVDGIGTVPFRIAFGGAYYAYVNADDIGLSLDAASYSAIIDAGRRIKHAVMTSVPVRHPFEDDLSFLYGTIFYSSSATPGVFRRNVCVFADGEVDRSPTGSGVSGMAALLHADGQLEPGQSVVIESITGSQFRVELRRPTTFGPYAAVIPFVEGQAFISGQHRFYLDPADPFPQGFFLR